MPLNINLEAIVESREEGIRTLDTVTHIHAFQACAFSHSATSLRIMLQRTTKFCNNQNLVYTISPRSEVSNIVLKLFGATF